MEDVKIKFFGTSDEQSTIEVFNVDREIFIEISTDYSGDSWMRLNKATAVQLVKKLKLEISKIQ